MELHGELEECDSRRNRLITLGPRAGKDHIKASRKHTYEAGCFIAEAVETFWDTPTLLTLCEIHERFIYPLLFPYCRNLPVVFDLTNPLAETRRQL
eukprot:736966-Rhodomonas_salina.1